MKFFTDVLRWLFGIGAFFHALFAMAAVLSPDQLALLTGIGRIAFSYVWVGQAGMLMFLIALMSIPALYNPRKFRVFVWILSAGTLFEGIYWLYVSSAGRQDVVFEPLARFWVSLGAFEVLIVLFLAERHVRFGLANVAQVRQEWKEARRESTLPMLWFGVVVFAYIILTLFPIYAHLFNQDLLRFPIGEGVLFHSWVWIALSGIELLVLTVLMLPVACAPTRYWSYGWLLIFAQLVAACFWFSVARHPLHWWFIIYALLDLLWAVPMFILLQKGAPADRKLTSHNFQEFLSFLSDTLALHSQPARIRTLAVVVFFMGLFMTWVIWYYFIRRVPDLYFGSDEMQYKYGAIGLSVETRVPWYLFEVMPGLFPELIPATGGPIPPNETPSQAMARFAKAMGVMLIAGDGQPQPVGFSLREIGFKTVEPNCALCHILEVKLPATPQYPRERKMHVLGAPNSALDIQSYQWFLYNAAVSPKFNVPTVMAAIDENHELGFLDRFFYRTIIIPATQSLLKQLRSDYTWQHAYGRAPHGRGRTDTFNTTKQGILLMPDDGTTGTTDLPQVWQLGRRHQKKMWLHWDGNNSSVPERNYTAAMAVGASPASVIPENFERLVRFFWRLPAAPYPYPIDRTLVDLGRPIFERHCAGCHSWRSPNVGKTHPVGTDPNRAITFTTEHCKDFKKISYPPFLFQNYRKLAVPQYVIVPLDGLWTRGPYLHHGAVPTLADLLKPAAERPKQFHRGYNVFDPVNVGFVSSGPEAEAIGTLYDTTLAGNCNAGHEYGTNLTPAEKLALIEFLKSSDPMLSGSEVPIPWPVDDQPTSPAEPCRVQTPETVICSKIAALEQP